MIDPGKIRDRRLELGLTQAQLAKDAGVSQQLITKIESGGVLESTKLVKIAAALRTTAEDLTTRGTKTRPISEWDGNDDALPRGTR